MIGGSIAALVFAPWFQAARDPQAQETIRRTLGLDAHELERLGGCFNTIFAFNRTASRDLEARINKTISAQWVAADRDGRRNVVLGAAVRMFRARLLAADAPVMSMEEAHARLLRDGEEALAAFESEVARSENRP